MSFKCKFDGCENTKRLGGAFGYCAAHYTQQKKGIELYPIVKNRVKTWVDLHLGYDGVDCLTWPFSRNPGMAVATMTHNGKRMPAARYICEKINGPAPSSIHQAAHNCGKGHLGCVNPKHLRWATPKENCADKIIHGTRQVGTRHGQAKLDDDKVRYIRKYGPMERDKKKMAKALGVAYITMWDVLAGKTWGHVI